jgi:UDP-GlcNAc:undecaprenyl-phosphate GlcNAc-1-phosphate transferase
MSVELLAGLLGLVVSSVLLPLVIRWGREQSLLDIPDDGRRRHAAPTPRVGGVAVFISVVLVSSLLVGWEQMSSGAEPAPLWLALLIGAAIVFVTGLVDDIRGVVPVLKLIGHATAAFVVIAAGFRVDSIAISGPYTFSLGFASIPITVLWIVGVTNAFNLIDGVDGLAATFSLIGLLAVIIVEWMIQPAPSLIVTTAAVGAMLAFLRYNRHPAKVFLGDSGSTTLGYFLSVQLVTSATDLRGVTYVLVPVFALAYPLTDTAIAIARRWLRGHPFSRADGRHIHHQLLSLGLSPTRAVDLLGLVFASATVMGISVAFAPPRIVLALVTGGGLLLFTSLVYGVRWLGYHEFSEFATSVVSVVRNARSHVRNKIRAFDLASELSAAKSLEEVKLLLAGAAQELGFLEVTLETQAQHYVGPSYRRIAPRSLRPLRIDCPIAFELPDGSMREATLRFWCERPGSFTYVGVERLATQLAPAVQHWLEINAGLLASADRRGDLPVRRSSGALDGRVSISGSDPDTAR